MSDKELNDRIDNINNHLHESFIELVKSEVVGSGWGPTKLQKMIKQERGWLLPGSNSEESSRLTQGVFFLCFAGVYCGIHILHSLAKDEGKAALLVLIMEDWATNFSRRSTSAYHKFELIDPFDEPLFFDKNVKKYFDADILLNSYKKYYKKFKSVALNENYNQKYEVSDIFMDSCEFDTRCRYELKTHINELFAKSIILPKGHL